MRSILKELIVIANPELPSDAAVSKSRLKKAKNASRPNVGTISASSA